MRGGGHHVVMARWQDQRMSAGTLDSCIATIRQIVSLSKDFYSGVKEKQERQTNIPIVNGGICWQMLVGRSVSDRQILVHIFVKIKQISDLCLRVSEVENGHSPWCILVQHFSWCDDYLISESYRAVTITVLKTKLLIC